MEINLSKLFYVKKRRAELKRCEQYMSLLGIPNTKYRLKINNDLGDWGVPYDGKTLRVKRYGKDNDGETYKLWVEEIFDIPVIDKLCIPVAIELDIRNVKIHNLLVFYEENIVETLGTEEGTLCSIDKIYVPINKDLYTFESDYEHVKEVYWYDCGFGPWVNLSMPNFRGLRVNSNKILSLDGDMDVIKSSEKLRRLAEQYNVVWNVPTDFEVPDAIDLIRRKNHD